MNENLNLMVENVSQIKSGKMINVSARANIRKNVGAKKAIPAACACENGK